MANAARVEDKEEALDKGNLSAAGQVQVSRSGEQEGNEKG